MKKQIKWNPINTEITPEEYERHVEKRIEKFVNIPGSLVSLYKQQISDIELLKSLEQVHMLRRTSEKPKWKGASGYDHQIDASFSTEDERVILLVECKHLSKSVDFQAFSAFLVRIIDIATLQRNSLVLGMLVTTQGHKGRGGGKEEDQDCIAKIQSQFSGMGYYVVFQWLLD